MDGSITAEIANIFASGPPLGSQREGWSGGILDDDPQQMLLLVARIRNRLQTKSGPVATEPTIQVVLALPLLRMSFQALNDLVESWE